MVYIKTKEGASLLVALLAAVIVAVTTTLLDVVWWMTLCAAAGVFVVMALVALFIIRKYVAYKLKPIYSIVLSRDVHTNEIFSELKDKHVENIGEELTAWADTNDKEIARLKETEQFRKQYLGNVAHELKTPIFNIQGYISTLLDGGLEDELINRKYLERAEKSIDRLINIVNDLDTISKLESNMNRLKMERFDIVALTKEIAEEKGLSVDEEGFQQRFRQHQENSHAGAEQRFKGGLADHTEETTKLHTATHLLHAALRHVLGDEVAQKGSNITAERLRFDFSFHRKMTPEEIQETERLVNEYIKGAAPIVCEEMTVAEAKAQGAIGLFESKYGERVKVYTMGEYSKEICGGPHASNTADLKSFKILKEESSSAGVRRIKAVIGK